MVPKSTQKNENGFTLIELMIVIAIIGILAAIAIPQFAAFKSRSYNSTAQADLRNAATAQEAYYVDEQVYCSTTGTLTGATYGLYMSENVLIQIKQAGGTTYSMVCHHRTGGDASFIIRGPGGSVSKF